MIAALALPVFLVGCVVLVGAMLLFLRQIGATVNACEEVADDGVVRHIEKTNPDTRFASEGPTGDDAPGPGNPPENFVEAYFEAANQPDAQLGPEGPYILMAIHEIESGFGRSDAAGVKSGVNFANCCKGPFQFYDTRKWSTWNARSSISDEPYGRDGDGDGDVDIYSNHDAMFAAAALLADSGAPEDWMGAIWAYNHLESYRQQVLSQAEHFEATVPPPSGFKPRRTVAKPEAQMVAAAAGCEAAEVTLVSQSVDGGAVDGGAYSQPLPKRSFMVTGQFWEWRDSYNHEGTDLAAPEGTVIRAIGGGKVTVAGEVSGYGLYTCIEHTQRLRSCYGHQSKLEVKVGQTVEQGESIGRVGTTGHSTGPHLHLEIYLDGVAVCPANYVGADPASWCAPGAPGIEAKPG